MIFAHSGLKMTKSSSHTNSASSAPTPKPPRHSQHHHLQTSLPPCSSVHPSPTASSPSVLPRDTFVTTTNLRSETKNLASHKFGGLQLKHTGASPTRGITRGGARAQHGTEMRAAKVKQAQSQGQAERGRDRSSSGHGGVPP